MAYGADGSKACKDGWTRLGLPLAFMPARLRVVDQPQRQPVSLLNTSRIALAPALETEIEIPAALRLRT